MDAAAGGDDAREASFPDRGPSVFAVTTATFVLATVFVVARTITRTVLVRRVSWDDYAMVVAWLIALGLSVAIDVGTVKGLGRHDSDIDPEHWDALRRTEYVFSILYNPALMATKTSILIFYLRLSKNTEKVLRLASWLVLGIVNVAGTVLTLLNIFQCRPISAAFDMYAGAAYCIPILTEFICAAPVNIVTDLAILALPLPVLTGMRLPLRQKVILILTFTLGVFVTIVDVVRIYYLQQAVMSVTPAVSSNPAATFGDQPEFAWNASLSFMWSAVEVNVGIICACIPTLKPLIIRILPAMLFDPDGTRRASSMVDSKPRTTSDRNGSGDSGQLHPVAGADLDKTTPPEPAHHSSGPDAPLSAMEFLTTPEMDMTARRSSSGATMTRQQTTMTNYTNTSNMENAIYFGFVNIRKPKSLIRTSARDSWKYCTLVTVLFFIWGFSYGLLNTLNNAIAVVADMSTPETLGLTSIYFGAGYFLGPLLVGEWVLRHDEHRRVKKKKNGSQQVGGFKATFMLGLCIYGTGTIMFWPSAVLTSFAGFMICNFVVGFGLAVLETAANPFLALCGPMDYSEMRLLFAQAVQAIGTVLSQVMAQRVFFDTVSTRDNTGSSTTLIDVQWTYLAITLFSAGLALLFYYMPLPEVTDAEMEHSTRYLPIDHKKPSFFGLQLRTLTLILAVVAQWTYVAGQESMSIYFSSLLNPTESTTTTTTTTGGTSSMTASVAPSLTLSASEFLLVAHSAFALSRLLAGLLAYLSPRHPHVPQPRTILNITNACSIACAIAICAIRPVNNPNIIVVPIVLFFFFEGPMWPLIFALGLRGQGSRTKRAAAYITMGASGPAFWPFVMYAIIQRTGSTARSSYQTAFIVVPALLVITGLFSLFLDLKRDARLLVDSRVGAEEQARIQDRANREMDLDAIMSTRRQRRRSSSVAAAAAAAGTTLFRKSTNRSGKGRGRQEGGGEAKQSSLAKRLSMAAGRTATGGAVSRSGIGNGAVRRTSSLERVSPTAITPTSGVTDFAIQDDDGGGADVEKQVQRPMRPAHGDEDSRHDSSEGSDEGGSTAPPSADSQSVPRHDASTTVPVQNTDRVHF
ncbi:major facilitator superfamily domain-containing protein [Microdochium trichocladiopsis]|uniref:Major facilitator superfamily domain-containing protein n=1 Tax=Microdochium trichocladiopsis TaxID=1682393 RepID=A0A9P8Y6S8_9PEZI|nr:major facilitator superfamily domain-containing protein [Microdochium trichocladiopsis]KAH7030758.1 major facilitator superfamily domain-containing protein [Microdochium trichocladiopsis]